MSEPTLAPCMGKLKRTERMHILCCLHAYGTLVKNQKFEALQEAHLPFVTVNDALFSLNLATINGMAGTSFRSKVTDKLKRLSGIDPAATESVIIYLNDGKVARRFGCHPERGIKLNGHTKRVTAGMKWSLPKKAYIPDDDTTVNQHFTLIKREGKGRWEVKVHHRHKTEVIRFLIDYCQ